ncbi:MAG: aminoacyl-tRNA deacylase [Asgard group archaeon]|nr:aminoacyl-tRNA deacylase [Asgard group archaeon]
MNLKQFLENHKVWHQFVMKSETIHTADAAHVTGIELHKVTKNLVSITDTGEYVLLIVPGDSKVNLKEVAKMLGVKKVGLVPFSDAEKISGYPPGGTPSVGHKTQMRTLIEKKLLNFETVYCGGGSRDKLLEIRVQDIIELNDAIIAELVE